MVRGEKQYCAYETKVSSWLQEIQEGLVQNEDESQCSGVLCTEPRDAAGK